MADLTYFQSVDPICFESVSAVTATPSVQLGTRRIVDGEQYVYLYNNGNSAINKGYGVVTSANSGFYVTVSSVTGYASRLFAVVKHATVSTNYYFWGMVRGYCTIYADATNSIAADSPLYLMASGVFNTLSMSTDVVKQPCGYCIDGGTATAGSSKCYIFGIG